MYKKAIEYLPHKSPMVFLEDVFDVQENSCLCGVNINDRGILKPFYEDSTLDTLFGIEMMAQCVGVWAGYYQNIDKSQIKLGMLIGINNIAINKSYFENEIYHKVFAKLVMIENSFACFDCLIEAKDEVLMKATINSFQIDTKEQLEAI